MINQFNTLLRRYPLQFWLLIFGQLISMIGSGFIWPFITLYMLKTLDISLSTVSLILTLRAGASLVSSLLIGPSTDKVGRKSIMVISLLTGGISFLLLDFANSLFFFAVLMAGWGGSQPLYSISIQAMIADLVKPEDRLGAYSLLRISNNVGVALGPVLGGILITISYSFTFYIAGICLILVSLFTIFFIKETLDPNMAAEASTEKPFQAFHGIFKDKFFILFCLGTLIIYTMSSQEFTLLPSYLKDNFGILENRTGFIMAVNATLIISLQFFVAKFIQKFNPMWLMATGAIFYIIGISSNALGSNMWHFIISIVILTIGELIIAPTSTTFTANYAPVAQRGRYMSFFGLANGVGFGLGPVIGALFNDNISPFAIWYGSGLIGLTAVILYAALAKKYKSSLNSVIK